MLIYSIRTYMYICIYLLDAYVHARVFVHVLAFADVMHIYVYVYIRF